MRWEELAHALQLRAFRELLQRSEEGIASNVLADRLKRLVEAGLLTRRADPTHKQKPIYSLAQPAIALVPFLAHMGAWGCSLRPRPRSCPSARDLLSDGGPRLWDAFMRELRALHTGWLRPRRSVLAELQYEKVAAKHSARPRS